MKILMVCLGNICRSPIAHGLLQHKADKLNLKWKVDSAGTSDWHEGELPNPKSIEVMKNHGVDITYQRSRPIIKQDLEDFDIIYVMDASNYQNVKNMAVNSDEIAKIHLIMNEVNPGHNQPVPDPWGLTEKHYEEVYEMLDKATDRVIEKFLENTIK
ncbi:MAG: low molecular weight protein-tyrosine-phosphatase [Chitinophagales bacterium]